MPNAKSPAFQQSGAEVACARGCGAGRAAVGVGRGAVRSVFVGAVGEQGCADLGAAGAFAQGVGGRRGCDASVSEGAGTGAGGGRHASADRAPAEEDGPGGPSTDQLCRGAAHRCGFGSCAPGGKWAGAGRGGGGRAARGRPGRVPAGAGRRMPGRAALERGGGELRHVSGASGGRQGSLADLGADGACAPGERGPCWGDAGLRAGGGPRAGFSGAAGPSGQPARGDGGSRRGERCVC